MDELEQELNTRLQAALGRPAEDRRAEVLRVFAAALGRAFGLQPDEVAILRLERDRSMLAFAFPAALAEGGQNAFPLSLNSLAGRVVQSGAALHENEMRQIPHLAFYERVRGHERDPLPIQKIMAAPVKNGTGGVEGVVEVSRRGRAPAEAGADFTAGDRGRLEALTGLAAAAVLQVLPPAGGRGAQA
ncbi:MAG: hypothetical protein ACE147_19805 [Candidatus Methylomirabilales bacterium]